MSDRERERDRRRLDKLLDAWDRELDADPSLEALCLASKALVPLLERRSRLLGLDVVPDGKAQENASSPVVARILAAVPK